jgi:hypothetical protein
MRSRSKDKSPTKFVRSAKSRYSNRDLQTDLQTDLKIGGLNRFANRADFKSPDLESFGFENGQSATISKP